jgi:hypothetical protein
MKIELSKLERRLLYNFVVGENNLMVFPSVDNLEEENGSFAVAVKRKLNYTNLNNLDGDKEEYGKALQKLMKKMH